MATAVVHLKMGPSGENTVPNCECSHKTFMFLNPSTVGSVAGCAGNCPEWHRNNRKAREKKIHHFFHLFIYFLTKKKTHLDSVILAAETMPFG